MNHSIIVKFKPECKDELKAGGYADIKAIFAHAPEISGIHGVKYVENCIARPNRYDLAIILQMDEEALPLWDACEWHAKWKKDFGASLESKAIFDFND